jgi:hypothetical protein
MVRKHLPFDGFRLCGPAEDRAARGVHEGPEGHGRRFAVKKRFWAREGSQFDVPVPMPHNDAFRKCIRPASRWISSPPGTRRTRSRIDRSQDHGLSSPLACYRDSDRSTSGRHSKRSSARMEVRSATPRSIEAGFRLED